MVTISGAMLAAGVGLTFAGGGVTALAVSSALVGAGAGGLGAVGGPTFNLGEWAKASIIGGVSGLASAAGGFGAGFVAGNLLKAGLRTSMIAGGAAGGFSGALAGQVATSLLENRDAFDPLGLVTGTLGGAIGGALGWKFTQKFHHQSGQNRGMLLCSANEAAFMRANIYGGVTGGAIGDVLNQGAQNWQQHGWEVDRWSINLGSVLQSAILGGLTAAGSAKAQWAVGRACFCAGTPLRTPDGSKPIEHFRVGDWILSRDENDPAGPVLSQRVEEVFVRTGRVWVLSVGGKEIHTTGEHPFFAENHGWKPLAELSVGDRLLGENGDWLTIEALEDTGRYQTVYNLKVAEFSTYFVGEQTWGWSVWAHNTYDDFRQRLGATDTPELRALYQSYARRLTQANLTGADVQAIWASFASEPLVRQAAQLAKTPRNGAARVKSRAWEQLRNDTELPAVPATVEHPPISIGEALRLAQEHLGGAPTTTGTSGSGAVQFIRTYTEPNSGVPISRIARFDINPTSPHVQTLGPHLNLETQVNGIPVRIGQAADPHHPIDPATIRPTDY